MKINTLRIENFKGVKALSLSFESLSAVISGANGTGKTTIADAFNWLLFGKDSSDSKQFGIRPINGDKEADTVVSATFAGGLEITKILHERWEKPKGQLEAIYKGTETKCEWNGAPMKISEFNARIMTEISPKATEESVKLCTRPEAFFKLKWDAQRNLLQQIAGTPTNEEINGRLNEDLDFTALSKGLTVEDFKKKTQKQISEIKKEAESIPARIEELSNMKQEVNTEAEAQLKAVEAEIKKINSGKVDIKALLAEATKKAEPIRNEINELSNQIFTTKRKAALFETEHAAKLNQIKDKKAVILESMKTCEVLLIQAKENKAAALAEWTETKNRAYSGDGLCPYCKQPLPEAEISKLILDFNNKKAEDLKAIESKGFKINEKIAETEGRIKAFEEDLKKIEGEYSEVTNEKAPSAETKALEEKKAALEEKYNEVMAIQRPDESASEATLKELEAKKDELKKASGAETFNADLEKRIAELREKGTAYGQQLAELEKDLYMAKQYESAKISLTEEKINGLFDSVKFKMFEYTIDGNPVDTCKATINGVDFSDLNTASKIQAGVEVTGVISRYFDIDLPLIIDNRESVTTINDKNGRQVISLKVDDKEKAVSYTLIH